MKAILFDFDGVLAETLSVHLEAWRVLFRERGLEPDELTLRLNEGAATPAIARALCLKAGQNVTGAEAKTMAGRKNILFRSSRRARPYPGARAILDRVRELNLETGLVTGTTRANLDAVLPAEWLEAFDVTIADGDTARGKPAPDPYRIALERLGIESRDGLVIENAPLGIASAKAAGCFCIALETTLPAGFLRDADVVLKNHEELLHYLDRISAISR